MVYDLFKCKHSLQRDCNSLHCFQVSRKHATSNLIFQECHQLGCAILIADYGYHAVVQILIIYHIMRVDGAAGWTHIYQRLIEMLVESALLYSATIAILLVLQVHNDGARLCVKVVAIAIRVCLTHFDFFFLMTATSLLGNCAYNFGLPRCSRTCMPRGLLEWKYHSVIASIQRTFKFTEWQPSERWIWTGHIFACKAGLGRRVRGQYMWRLDALLKFGDICNSRLIYRVGQQQSTTDYKGSVQRKVCKAK